MIALRRRWLLGGALAGAAMPGGLRAQDKVKSGTVEIEQVQVAFIGSGNVVHNLHAYAWGRHAPEPYDWAISFETRIRERLVAGEYKPLVN